MITLDGDKKEKKPPVKAEPPTDKDGGIFTSKIILIMEKIKHKIQEWRESRKKKGNG